MENSNPAMYVRMVMKKGTSGGNASPVSLGAESPSANCPKSLSAVSGSPVFDGWSRHALCGRFGYSDSKEASVRGPMYFVSDSGDSDGGLGWRYGSGESIRSEER